MGKWKDELSSSTYWKGAEISVVSVYIAYAYHKYSLWCLLIKIEWVRFSIRKTFFFHGDKTFDILRGILIFNCLLRCVVNMWDLQSNWICKIGICKNVQETLRGGKKKSCIMLPCFCDLAVFWKTRLKA